MNNEAILKEDNISFTDTEMLVGKKKILLSNIDSIYIGEQNPAKDRGYAYIAVGVVLIIFTSRWFMAAGYIAVLAGIVTFFDSRRKYTVFIKNTEKDLPVAASYDLMRIKKIESILKEKTAS